MTKVAILGLNGMLGSKVFEVFSKADYEIAAGAREVLDAQKASVSDIQRVLFKCDYAVNCIGIIKPYIHDDNSFEVQRAIEVNALFPHRLAEAAENTNTKVIQIATDCVYNGAKDGYNETDKHNALDVYGKTKSLGEVHSDNFLNLRCSIIGREKKSYLSLLEWFLNQPKNAKVNGFNNHLWNGVTTQAFAKICLGLIKNDSWFNGSQHVIPADIVTKAQMLKIFAEHFNRNDIEINDIDADISINRTLFTINPDKNKQIWNMAGYENVPTVKQMIKEIE